MKADVVLERLEQVAEQLGIKVSYEQLATSVGISKGGLCRVKGQFRVIIDKRATAAERVTTLATALGRFDTTEFELPAPVREALYTHGGRPATPTPARRAS